MSQNDNTTSLAATAAAKAAAVVSVTNSHRRSVKREKKRKRREKVKWRERRKRRRERKDESYLCAGKESGKGGVHDDQTLIGEGQLVVRGVAMRIHKGIFSPTLLPLTLSHGPQRRQQGVDENCATAVSSVHGDECSIVREGKREKDDTLYVDRFDALLLLGESNLLDILKEQQLEDEEDEGDGVGSHAPREGVGQWDECISYGSEESEGGSGSDSDDSGSRRRGKQRNNSSDGGEEEEESRLLLEGVQQMKQEHALKLQARMRQLQSARKDTLATGESEMRGRNLKRGKERGSDGEMEGGTGEEKEICETKNDERSTSSLSATTSSFIPSFYIPPSLVRTLAIPSTREDHLHMFRTAKRVREMASQRTSSSSMSELRQAELRLRMNGPSSLSLPGRDLNFLDPTNRFHKYYRFLLESLTILSLDDEGVGGGSGKRGDANVTTATHKIKPLGKKEEKRGNSSLAMLCQYGSESSSSEDEDENDEDDRAKGGERHTKDAIADGLNSELPLDGQEEEGIQMESAGDNRKRGRIGTVGEKIKSNAVNRRGDRGTGRSRRSRSRSRSQDRMRRRRAKSRSGTRHRERDRRSRSRSRSREMRHRSRSRERRHRSRSRETKRDRSRSREMKNGQTRSREARRDQTRSRGMKSEEHIRDRTKKRDERKGNRWGDQQEQDMRKDGSSEKTAKRPIETSHGTKKSTSKEGHKKKTQMTEKMRNRLAKARMLRAHFTLKTTCSNSKQQK